MLTMPRMNNQHFLWKKAIAISMIPLSLQVTQQGPLNLSFIFTLDVNHKKFSEPSFKNNSEVS